MTSSLCPECLQPGMREVTREELFALGRAAGFELLHLYADFTWTEPNADSERLFFVAHKPG